MFGMTKEEETNCKWEINSPKSPQIKTHGLCMDNMAMPLFHTQRVEEIEGNRYLIKAP